jgi:hypothetical protein
MSAAWKLRTARQPKGRPHYDLDRATPTRDAMNIAADLGGQERLQPLKYRPMEPVGVHGDAIPERANKLRDGEF